MSIFCSVMSFSDDNMSVCKKSTLAETQCGKGFDYSFGIANGLKCRNKIPYYFYIYFPPFIIFFPYYFLLKIDIFDIKEIKY